MEQNIFQVKFIVCTILIVIKYKLTPPYWGPTLGQTFGTGQSVEVSSSQATFAFGTPEKSFQIIAYFRVLRSSTVCNCLWVVKG